MPQDPVADLLEFLRFPSISTQSDHTPDLAACAGWLVRKFTSLGFTARQIPTDGHPVVVAHSPRDPARRTVLVYGHYDVQPPDPLDEWETAPFEPVIRDGKIFARGATDNKGQILAHMLGAGEALAASPLPVNLVFLVEGEEEIGSPHLGAFLEVHRDELACDVILISDSGMVADNWPTLAYSLRGIAALEIAVSGPSQDLHSGVFGGAVMNPATAVARLIASLHDADGRVAIDGFYDDVVPLAPWEREAAAALPITDADLLTLTGAPALFGEAGYSSIERIGARPTAEINGLGGGYQGEGTKTVLPREAFAKITFRLVPRQDPRTILRLAEKHLRAHCPPGVHLTVLSGHSGDPYFVNPHSDFGKAACRALERVFGRPPALLREGGSIPIVNTFAKVLGAETLLLALASPDCRVHAPNENFPVANFEAGIRLHRAAIEEIARA